MRRHRGNLDSSEIAGQRAGRDRERGDDAGQLRTSVPQPHLESGDRLTTESEDGNGDR